MLSFRPLIGGIGIFNPRVGTYGTAGLIARSDDGDRWLISCYHVLARADFSEFDPSEAIFQPWGLIGQTPVARLERGDAGLDCAAARVEGANAEGRILGIGAIQAPALPATGMRVVKSGIATGVTEGVVDAVANDLVTIRSENVLYDLAGVGDSGAVWVHATTRAPIALHRASIEGAGESAIAISLPAVLASLGLDALIGA